jgi:hypothetical protein
LLWIKLRLEESALKLLNNQGRNLFILLVPGAKIVNLEKKALFKKKPAVRLLRSKGEKKKTCFHF